MAFFSTTESILNTYFNVAVAYILANLLRLGVSIENKATMIAELATWNNIYPLASTVATSNAANVKDKNKSKGKMKAILRLIFGDFLNSVLTSTDRLTLNIPVIGGVHGAMPIPASTPEGIVDDSFRLAHKLTYLDSASGKKGKPHGATGCEIWYKVDGAEPTSIDELTFIDTITKLPLMVGFEGVQAGKKVWYWMRWINKTTKGNWGSTSNGTVLP